MPWSRSAATASKASMSPRSSPAKRKAPASSSSTRVSTTRPLCMPCERTSITLPAGLDDQVVALRRARAAAAAAARTRRPGRRAAGCARRRRAPCPRPRRRRPRRGAARRAAPRSNDARPCGGRGERIRRLVELPALVAVLPEDVELRAVARRCALPTSSSPPRSSACRAGRPVITAIAATWRGEVDEHLAGVGVDVRGLRVVDDRRQGAVEVEPDDAVGGRAHQGGVPLLTLGGGELHGPTPSPPSRRAPESGQRTGEDDREPVERIGSTAGGRTPDAEVERELLARPP